MSPSSPVGLLLGAERPRVELRPADAVDSLGPAAVELAQLAGLELEQWQVDGIDLMMSIRSDGTWACTDYCEICSRQNGKTAMIYARVLAGLFLLPEERLIVWTAHELDTAMESFLKLEELIDNLVEAGLVEPVVYTRTNGKYGITTADGTRLKFKARSSDSGRGFTGDLVIIDEAYAYKAAQQSALEPTQNARPNAQTVYASSPPLDSQSGEVLFSLRERAESGETEGLGYRDFGLAIDLVELGKLAKKSEKDLTGFLADRAKWAETNPALGRGRVTERAIAKNLRNMKPLDFAREILGVWPVPPKDSGRVITRVAWDALVDPDSGIVGRSVMVIDANPELTRAVIATAGHRVDEIPHVELIAEDAGLDWVVERADELNVAHQPVWVMDAASPASVLLPALKKVGIVPVLLANRELGQACGAMFSAIEQRGVFHLGDPILDDAVRATRKRLIGDGLFAWARKSSASNIAPFVAATIAVWGVIAHLVAPAPEPVAVASTSAARPDTADLAHVGF